MHRKRWEISPLLVYLSIQAAATLSTAQAYGDYKIVNDARHDTFVSWAPGPLEDLRINEIASATSGAPASWEEPQTHAEATIEAAPAFDLLAALDSLRDGSVLPHTDWWLG